MALASNISEEIRKTKVVKEEYQEKLRLIKDSVEKFNEIDCASGRSALGRYSAKDTMNVLKSFAKLVK